MRSLEVWRTFTKYKEVQEGSVKLSFRKFLRSSESCKFQGCFASFEDVLLCLGNLSDFLKSFWSFYEIL